VYLQNLWPNLIIYASIESEPLPMTGSFMIDYRHPNSQPTTISGELALKRKLAQMLLITVFSFLALTTASAQLSTTNSPPALSSASSQNISSQLASLPEADALIYVNPRRILNEAAPRVMTAADLSKMRTLFDDLKKGSGVDPASIDYLVIALRFHKPAANLSFVPPEVVAVISGDFSSDSLLTLARLSLQDRLRDEKYGARTLAIMKIEPIAIAAEKNPLLKSFAEIGFAPLNANSIAVGNIGYLKAAIDAADGTGRISNNTVSSLLRDPNALASAAGSPLVSFAKSFGLLGTQTTPRDSRCDTTFGNFYTAITFDGNNFSVRGAMNADNPDTAKIINGLLSGLLQQAVTSVPDKAAQNVLNNLKLSANDNEVVLSADIPHQVVADFIREQSKPAAKVTAESPAKAPVRKKRTVRRRA
jgi:hypothetical protein